MNIKKSSRLGWVLTVIFAVMFLCLSILLSINIKSGTLNNLANVSTDTPARRNQTYRVIWYRDTCPHCRETIPTEYLLTHLTFQRVQYRDLNAPYNATLQARTRDYRFPVERDITPHQKRVSSQPKPMLKWTSPRVILFLALDVIFICCVAYGLANLVLLLCV